MHWLAHLLSVCSGYNPPRVGWFEYCWQRRYLIAPHCEQLHPKCKHCTYTIPVIFRRGNPQSTGPTGGEQASSVCVCVSVCVQAGMRPVPPSVPNAEPSQLLSGNRQAKSAQSDLFCCRVPLGVCSLPKLTPACLLQLASPFSPSFTSKRGEEGGEGEEGREGGKPKIARQWMSGLGATPTDVVRALPLFALPPSSEAPNYENPDSFTWLCLI